MLTGAGDRAFCAGADLSDNPMNLFRAVPNVARPLDKPVIAAVHGHVIGGGYVLAQHCDLIVAADSAACPARRSRRRRRPRLPDRPQARGRVPPSR